MNYFSLAHVCSIWTDFDIFCRCESGLKSARQNSCLDVRKATSEHLTPITDCPVHSAKHGLSLGGGGSRGEEFHNDDDKDGDTSLTPKGRSRFQPRGLKSKQMTILFFTQEEHKPICLGSFLSSSLSEYSTRSDATRGLARTAPKNANWMD